MAFCGQGSGRSLELDVWGGTIGNHLAFNADEDAKALKDAMKGMGTDEDKIIKVVVHRSNAQRQTLKETYNRLYKADLIKDLKSELGGNFEDCILALFRETDEFDAWCLYDAMDGLGTNENTLIEILSTRTNEELKRVKPIYKTMAGKEVTDSLTDETSGVFKNLLIALAQVNRPESKASFFAFWNYLKARKDARALYRAGEKNWGTNEGKFQKILTSRSPGHLEMVFGIYDTISKRGIEDAIRSEMVGEMENGMLAIVKCAKDKIGYFAECLYESMKGVGTNDKTLIRIMVSRSEKDLVRIKHCFKAKYKQELEKFIAEDCSGDYKKLLIQICRGNAVV